MDAVDMETDRKNKAQYHLPGLFEHYEFYQVFLPLFYEHREFFYEWCDIGSVYGAPKDCIWSGGRVGFGREDPQEVFDFVRRIWDFSTAYLQQYAVEKGASGRSAL